MPDVTNINNLKSVIINRISDQVDTIQDTAAYEKTNFRGFPAVTVSMSGNENDFISSTGNKRVYVFIVRIYEQTENVPTPDLISDNAKQRAEDILGRVVSDMLDAFDQFYEFGGAADYMRAAPSAWGYAKIGSGWARTAEIKLEVVKEHLIT